MEFLRTLRLNNQSNGGLIGKAGHECQHIGIGRVERGEVIDGDDFDAAHPIYPRSQRSAVGDNVASVERDQIGEPRIRPAIVSRNADITIPR